MGPCRSYRNRTTSALQLEELTSKGTRVSYVYYQKKCPYKKSLETYLMILIYIYIYIYIMNQSLDRQETYNHQALLIILIYTYIS